MIKMITAQSQWVANQDVTDSLQWPIASVYIPFTYGCDIIWCVLTLIVHINFAAISWTHRVLYGCWTVTFIEYTPWPWSWCYIHSLVGQTSSLLHSFYWAINMKETEFDVHFKNNSLLKLNYLSILSKSRQNIVL